MSKWVELSRDLVTIVRREGEAALFIDTDRDDKDATFCADTEVLQAGEGSLDEPKVRKFLWDYRVPLKECTAIYAKEAEGRWMICGGKENSDG